MSELKCPKCGAPEIEADTPATVYECQSRDYDQRPGTFNQSHACLAHERGVEIERLKTEIIQINRICVEEILPIEERILFLDNGYPCVYMPTGRPEDGGTCSYATGECLTHCPSYCLVNEHEKRVLEFFKNNNTGNIADRILRELDMFGTCSLYWYPWGDCLDSLTRKTSEIICMLADKEITQNGFTRNRELWDRLPSNEYIRFGLSVDSIGIAKAFSVGGHNTCCPDIETGEARIFYKGEMVARCSGWWCRWIEENRIIEADCVLCIRHEKGCFKL